jgi:hypothetical protein
VSYYQDPNHAELTLTITPRELQAWLEQALAEGVPPDVWARRVLNEALPGPRIVEPWRAGMTS